MAPSNFSIRFGFNPRIMDILSRRKSQGNKKHVTQERSMCFVKVLTAAWIRFFQLFFIFTYHIPMCDLLNYIARLMMICSSMFEIYLMKN